MANLDVSDICDLRISYPRSTGPNSAYAHALLHTGYAGRKSIRLLLMRFLDCVDRRDGAGAASLLHPDIVWETDSALGEISGIANVMEVIDKRLPPRKFGPGYVRHRMASAADDDDLTVLTPTGERCQFRVEVKTVLEGGQPRTLISKLERQAL